jgi:hypothetical protein
MEAHVLERSSWVSERFWKEAEQGSLKNWLRAARKRGLQGVLLVSAGLVLLVGPSVAWVPRNTLTEL